MFFWPLGLESSCIASRFSNLQSDFTLQHAQGKVGHPQRPNCSFISGWSTLSHETHGKHTTTSEGSL